MKSRIRGGDNKTTELLFSILARSSLLCLEYKGNTGFINRTISTGRFKIAYNCSKLTSTLTSA